MEQYQIIEISFMDIALVSAFSFFGMRVKRLLALMKAGAVAAACSFCITMLTDGIAGCGRSRTLPRLWMKPPPDGIGAGSRAYREKRLERKAHNIDGG